MATRDKTCEERIGDELESREQYLAGLFAVRDGDADTFSGDYDAESMTDEQAQERLDELPLAVTFSRTMRIELSTGGPADYLTATLYREPYGWAVDSLTYHFADWFDHAERKVHTDSPLWRYAAQMAELAESIED